MNPEARIAELGLTLPNPPVALGTGEQTRLDVMVKNLSDIAWFARERSASAFQLQLGNHWLDENGAMLINDDGRAALPYDISPGETANLPLVVNAPRSPGKYILEVDMLQEGVSWFGLRGSNTLRVPVIIR